MTLPNKVIKEDHQLENAAERSGESLAAHRWHWTLDTSNTKRVSLREYARAVGRSDRAVTYMVNGYVKWMAAANGTVRTRSLSDEIELAKVSVTKQAAVTAIAQATGRSITAVASGHRNEVDSLVLDAQKRAERRGTTVEEEIPRVAVSRARTHEVHAKTERERKARYGFRFIQIDGHILSAKRYLMKALQLAEDVADEEEKELLRESIANLVALMHLIDARLGGTPDIDWDAELAKLGGMS